MTQETKLGINEFETWAQSNGLDWDLTFCPHGGYADEATGMAYLAWQARTTDTELTRLKRKVEVLREGYAPILSGNLPDGDIVDCSVSLALHIENVIAAADRIAKGEV